MYLTSHLDDMRKGEFESENDFYNLINNIGDNKDEGYESSNDEDDHLYAKET